MKIPRLIGWQIASLLLLILIYILAPQQLPVTLYKLSLVTMAGVAGYWLDRSLFPYAPPDSFMDVPPHKYSPIAFAAAMLRRAIIVAAAMIAMGLGA